MRKTSAFKKVVQVYKLEIPVFESKTQRNNLNLLAYYKTNIKPPTGGE